jgi:2-polyprenyl-6-methoxyphenol hydroxylase-like FAD-dependent oxidoreductase
MYDVIVVGARCAGASLAMLLARAGHRVAMVDRASFPSDTMSTHFLWQRGASRLDAWGLLDRLQERGCAPIKQITFDVGPVQLSGIGPAVGGVADTYCPRRTVLDGLLVDAAVEAGVELVEGVVVDDLVWCDGRVVGVEGHRRGSAPFSMRARFVVGADGLHSTVANTVGAHTYRGHPALTGVYYSYWSGISSLGASFHARPGRLLLVWPTNDDLTCVYVAWPHHEFSDVQKDVEGNFHDALGLVPGLRDIVTSGHREQRFVGTNDLPNFYRSSVGPGWALAGDAGHFKDPSIGMGMSDAFLAADLLADALHDGLVGHRPIDDAVASYQFRRDELTANGFALALSTAKLTPLSAKLESFYRSAADQPDVIRQIFGVLGGSVPIRDVYSDDRLDAVLTRANTSEPDAELSEFERRRTVTTDLGIAVREGSQ